MGIPEGHEVRGTCTSEDDARFFGQQAIMAEGHEWAFYLAKVRDDYWQLVRYRRTDVVPLDTPPQQGAEDVSERDQIVAWLRSFDGLCECRIAEGAYIRGSTAHGDDRDMAGWFAQAADRIEAGEHLGGER